MRFGQVSALLVLLLCGCGGGQKSEPPTQPARQSGGEQPVFDKQRPMFIKDLGFRTPESVVHDEQADVYLVSNIDGSPLEADDRAFIARVRPDGTLETLRWIDAAQPGVELNAPKGMAIAGEILYVADIEALHKFERRTGKPLGSIPLPGASFANDVCVDRAGNVYITDSGIAPGFTPSGSDAIYRVSPAGELSVLVKDVALGHPNGLAESDEGLWVATFGSGELYRVGDGGEREERLKPPKGSLDGVVSWQGRLFVASWEASAVYEREGSEFVERVTDVAAPSDIGLDRKRGRLLIPLFYDNMVVIYPL